MRTPSSGSDEIFLRIADITLAVTAKDPGLKLGVEGAGRRFVAVADGAAPDVRIRTDWRDFPEERYGRKIFDSAAFWQLYESQGSYLFRFISPVAGSRTYKVASFAPDFSVGEVHLHPLFFPPEKPIAPLDSSLDQLLVTNWLAKGRGALVHACGVIDALGNGLLFCGQSGAGKTTTAGLWVNEPGATILSDDRIVLRREGSQIWMHGTPWHGEAGLAFPGKSPLTGIYFLSHARDNELLPQEKTQALARLLACGFPPFYSPAGLDFTLGFLEEAVRAVPCYELRFRPTRRVLELVQNHCH